MSKQYRMKLIEMHKSILGLRGCLNDKRRGLCTFLGRDGKDNASKATAWSISLIKAQAVLEVFGSSGASWDELSRMNRQIVYHLQEYQIVGMYHKDELVKTFDKFVGVLDEMREWCESELNDLGILHLVQVGEAA